jgi:uncharacterized membrane protein YphA (DoxX/SURF4 family)
MGDAFPSFGRLEGGSNADAIGRQHKPSFLAKLAAATRPIPKLWTSLFGGIAWPYIELAIRLWIAKLFGFFGFMQMLHWETTLAVASQENPIPFLAPNSAAFLSTAIYIVCAVLLAIGFMTRYAALPLLLLSLITQLYDTPFDTQLFWMALAGWFAIHGAGPISVDNLLRRGLSDSAVPLIPRIIGFSKRLRAYGTPVYISLFRVWLGIALLMAAFGRSWALSSVTSSDGCRWTWRCAFRKAPPGWAASYSSRGWRRAISPQFCFWAIHLFDDRPAAHRLDLFAHVPGDSRRVRRRNRVARRIPRAFA